MTDGGARTKLAVIFGGRSPEHGISCLSAAGILAEVNRDDHDVAAIGITADGAWCAVDDDPDQWRRHDGQLPQVTGVATPVAELLSDIDVAFPVLHGRFGEDGTIQGLLEMLDIPYVGSGVMASAICMDKAMTKTVLKAHDVPVGHWVAATAIQWATDRDRIESRIAQLGLPIFVKPARAGSSVGISKVTHASEVARAVRLALLHDAKFIAEAAVLPAREIEVGVISSAGRPPRVSVPAEIIVDPSHEFYDFEAKYLDGSAQLSIPADLAPETASSVADLAAVAFEVLGCAGLARVDFFVTQDDRAVLNEANTMPGFTPTSGFPKMWQSSGLSYPDLIAHLINEALVSGA